MLINRGQSNSILRNLEKNALTILINAVMNFLNF